MKTNLEQKKELVMTALDHYIECTKTLANSINETQDTKLQDELDTMVKAVNEFYSATLQHRTAEFEAHGWELV